MKKKITQVVALGMSLLLLPSVSYAAVNLTPIEIDVPTSQAAYLDYLNDIKEGKIVLPIKKLDEIDISKEEASKKYKHAMNLVDNYIKDNQLLIKNDIDNADYQMLVISLGVALEQFPSSEQSSMLEYVKFMDRYENKRKNNLIESYDKKLSSNDITTDEIVDLIELMPVADSEKATIQSTPTEITEAQTNTVQSNNSVEQSVYQNSTSKFISPMAYSNGYSSIKARDYAYKWWDGRNPTYSYYAKSNNCSIASKECWKKWNDCTNFVSQALLAGGMEEWPGLINRSTSWYYADSLINAPSHSWGGANSFYKFWSIRSKTAPTAAKAAMGDPVNADFDNDGDINHTALITLLKDGHFYLTQHTSDKKNAPLSNWYSSGYKVYIWKMDQAIQSQIPG
ncbi:amidase domain-containing protein [Paenibacillus sp. Z6-24]